jgi:hypothetical protein
LDIGTHASVAILVGMRDEATFRVKAGLAEMLKGGVIMDVVTADQARIAEDAGAAAVMALERVPADIRRDGGVARMSDPLLIKGIQEAVTIPVMAKAWRRSTSITSTSPRSSRRPTRPTTSTSGRSRSPSCAVPPTSARRCGASARARR